MLTRPNRSQRRRIDTERITPGRTTPSIQIILSGPAVQKILHLLLPPKAMPSQAEQTEAHHLRPTLRPWIGIIDQILKEDSLVPKRYRATVMQILKTLREEHGFTGGYTVVQEYVRQARCESGQSPSRRSQNVRRKSSPMQSAIHASAEVSPLAKTTTEHLTSTTRPLRLSLQLRKPSSSEEVVFDWMQSIVQGAIPLESLASELGELPEKELKVLFAAATKGERPARNRALVVLAYARGINASPICSFLQISKGSLFRYWRDFQQGGTKKLLFRKPRSDKKACIPAIQNAVFSLLHSPPSAHGFNRTTWRLADMKAALGEEYNDAISCDVIREIIVNAGWKWRLARRVLTSNDPEYREKVDRIKKTLAELGNDEAFFSVDEYGPFAIKKKGGLTDPAQMVCNIFKSFSV
jgi:transposase